AHTILQRVEVCADPADGNQVERSRICLGHTPMYNFLVRSERVTDHSICHDKYTNNSEARPSPRAAERKRSRPASMLDSGRPAHWKPSGRGPHLCQQRCGPPPAPNARTCGSNSVERSVVRLK